MRHAPRIALASLVLLVPACRVADPAQSDATASDSDDAEWTRHSGLFPLLMDARTGRVRLEFATPGPDGVLAECLYIAGIATGLGANDVGLDRGKLGGAVLVRFRLVGDRVFVERPNLGFRATSDDSAERRAAEESFATSVLWSGKALAPDRGGDPGGHVVVVDVTDFVVRDAAGVAATLERTGQGTFRLDAQRSVLDPSGCLAFPDNLELEAILTFASDKPGREVRATAPDPRAVTIVQHHSFVRLPERGYVPRPYDPRMGSFSVSYLDYGAGLDQPIQRRLAPRHRLEKIDSRATRSRVRAPLVYYVDRGAPEPVRSALVEGASWWAEAFDAAGFADAFRVELLPEGAHPLDVRYNVIQWVHRSTRGWSYGNGVRDPRTGEIIKGHVSLGSLRVRQDRLIFEGLAGVSKTGSGAADDPIELALARIRQLSAHEVGHTLGLGHNFTASTYGRASVMDYPAPRVRVGADGELDFSGAYGIGVGAWDRHAIAMLYSDLDERLEPEVALDRMARAAATKGLAYHSDSDARPAGAAQRFANLWDDGSDPVDGLESALAVRAVALARFGPENLATGRPLAELQEVFVPVYLHHRYQVEAAVKVLGGIDFEHSANGDGRVPARSPDAAAQQRALAVLLRTLDPEALDVPERLLQILLPRPPGYAGSRELFRGRTGAAFDALAAAEVAARITISGLTNRERVARLIDQHRREVALPGAQAVFEALAAHVFSTAHVGAPEREVVLRGVVQRVLVEELGQLAADPNASGEVRGVALQILAELDAELKAAQLAVGPGAADVVRTVRRALEIPVLPAPLLPSRAETPPGSPIGSNRPRAGWDAASGAAAFPGWAACESGGLMPSGQR